MDKAESINIICWKWNPLPGVPRTKKKASFHFGHVNALYAMLERNLPISFTLHCVTDDPAGIWADKINIINLWEEFRDLGGCFLRLVCFKKDFSLFGERFFSIDLDCVITGDVTDIFTRPEDFIIWKPENKLHRMARYCGSLFALTAGTRPEVYDSFDPLLPREQKNGKYLGGTDQLHISETIKDAAVFTQQDGVYNFVPDLRLSANGLPEDAKIVFFNGRYMPDDDILLSQNRWIGHYYPMAGANKTRLNKRVEDIRLRRQQSRARNKQSLFNSVPKSERTAIKNLPSLTFVMYWWGNWPEETGLGPRYIEKLVKGINANVDANQSYQIVLFTDETSFSLPGVDTRKLDVPENLMWNLKKMYMYSSMAGLEGLVLCLDLDCVVTGKLSPIINTLQQMQQPELLYTCQAAYKKGAAGGSVIGFRVCKKLERLLWKPIVDDQKTIEEKTDGSERIYFRQQLNRRYMKFWEDKIPGVILSYKRDCQQGLPEGSSIVRFHGQPRPHDVKDSWVNWEKNN